MNDTTFVEASRMIAGRVLREAAPDDASRIDRLLLLVLSRPATGRERALLLAQLAGNLAEFRDNPAAADQLLSAGDSPRDSGLDAAELAAWTLTASTVLNMDEAVMLR